MPGTRTSKGFETVDQTVKRAEQMMAPLTSTDLASARPMNITPADPATQASGMLGEIESNADAFTEALTQNRESAEKGMEGARSPYQDFLQNLRGGQSLTAEAYDTGGVNRAESDLNDINQQIRNEQRSLENRRRSLEEKGGGLQGGMQAEVNNLERESLRKQADLYVIQQGVQGKYDSAKAIADRAVSAYLEAQRLELDALKFNYEENKELFNKAEQREFDVMYGDRERRFKAEEAELKTISDLSLDALQNGAPTQIASQMRQAKTLAEAMEIGGQYVGAQDRLLRSLQIAKMQKEIQLLGEPSEKEKQEIDDAIKNAEASASIAQEKISAIDILKKHKGLDSRVGPVGFARRTFAIADKFSGEGQDFAGGIHKLTGGLTLSNLIEAKKQGATFGALTQKELEILAASATKLNDWEVKDDDGNPTGEWNIDEESFNAELDEIKRLTTKALIQSGESLISDEEEDMLNSYFESNTVTPGLNYY